jgi:hypothetical protein
MDELRKRFRTARGNFDLYVLFIERALELLKPSGRCGLIIPNKWATLDYARACRELLHKDATIEKVIDLSSSKVFTDASVYPHILIFCKQEPTPGGLRFPDRYSLAPALDVESRRPTKPLGILTKLSCGTAGFSAQRIAARLVEADRETGSARAPDFITSGNIDRYAIRPGHVRYLNRMYVRPCLPLDSPELTSAKRKLFQSPKIVVAGMSRRLEAAWDARGLALGVQVFAVSEFQFDPFYLLGLLNSKLITYLFATRFAAKRLSGGYLAINKGQLARLPIAVVSRKNAAARRLTEMAESWRGPHHDEESDRLAYELYGLRDLEIDSIEEHFAQGFARAA